MGVGRKRASSLSPGPEPGKGSVKVTRFFNPEQQVQSEGSLGRVRLQKGVCLQAWGKAVLPGTGKMVAIRLLYC